MPRFALFGFLLISSAAVIAEPVVGAPPASALAPGARNRVTGELCQPALSIPAARRGTPSSKKLGELPPGNMMLTVVREVDGCMTPVIVRQGLSGSGASGKAKPPRRASGASRL